MARLHRFIWRPIPGVTPDAHRQPVDKLLLHTTEGTTIAGAESVYDRRLVPPHITYHPASRVGHQHLDTSHAAEALWDVDDTGVIQVELVGRAAETPGWPDDWYRNIAEDIVAPIVEAHPGIPLSDRHPSGGRLVWSGDNAYGQDAPQRLTRTEWSQFRGICGHQHAPPRNDHWDPGAFRIDDLLRHAAPAPPEDDDMAGQASEFVCFAKREGDQYPAVFAVWRGGYKTWVRDGAALELMRNMLIFSGWSADDLKIKVWNPVHMRATGPIVGAVPSKRAPARLPRKIDRWGA